MKRLQALFLALAAVLLVSGVTIFPRDSFAVPLQVKVLETNYTTVVSTSIFPSGWGDDGSRTDTSRTKSSSNPISDYMYGEPEVVRPSVANFAEAAAEARLFEVSVFGTSSWSASAASAKTEIIFSPLLDGSKNLKIDFAGNYEWFFSNGFVSLLDRTSNQELWIVGWECCGQKIQPNQTIVPWVEVPYGNPIEIETAALTLDTYFASNHIYDLTMYAAMTSNSDSKLIKMHLSGLEVPEPTTMLLLGSGLVGLVGFRRKLRK